MVVFRKDIDSLILRDKEDLRFFKHKILGSAKSNLVYRGSRDGFLASNFHQNCDGVSNTIVLIQNENDRIFGGYTSVKWSSNAA